MGLFGFGKKKHQSKEALEAAAGENEEAVDAAENVDEKPGSRGAWGSMMYR